MNKFRVILPCAMAIHLAAGPLQDIKRVKNVDQLARFIHDKSTQHTSRNYLIAGLQSKETISIKGYSASIPIREIFGTIVEDCYNEKLGNNFFESNKTYVTREICSFRSSNDELFRYHITIFEERQYLAMIQFLFSPHPKTK